MNSPPATSTHLRPDLEAHIDRAAAAHGHLCPGTIVGVRMALLGLSLLGYEAPLNDRDIKLVIAFVEIDRCLADAVATTTGLKLGRRSLKFKDLGLLAATFLDLPTGRAVRIVSKDNARALADLTAPLSLGSHERQIEAYRRLSDEDMFEVTWVEVDLPEHELPGYSKQHAACERCGIGIRHRREVIEDGRTLCAVCAGKAYFTFVK
ncbi:MAG: formylmethanofuran dehydrogenase [Proteobacteria bacterium]|nr:formylmethanofuran dehydrogenase [Pseudomonadota bacterium]MBU1740992.1 formylmethanofuran dehydrogenase [Pseudomonadota bacterium]